LNRVSAHRSRKAEDGERRCLVTGEARPREGLVRFVAGPGGEVVPDVEECLPGRGLWVTARRDVVKRAVAGTFSKAAKRAVKVPPDLAERTERRLGERLKAELGLARRAGLVVLGFDNVRKALDAGTPPRLLVEASDGAADGREKLLAAAAARKLSIETLDCLSGAELSLALGRENVIHAAVKPGPLADRLLADGARVRGFRVLPMKEMAGPTPVRYERDA